MIASDEPTVAVPTGVHSAGALSMCPSMLTTRSWIASVCGYSSWSMRFLFRVSRASRSACGSIQVVTKEARLSAGLPSRLSSSRTSCRAASAGIPVRGMRYLGTSCRKYRPA
jgi:hypothetical protein